MQLQLHQLSLQRAGIPLAVCVNAQCNSGDIVHITGSNGTGKTTLLLTIVGVLPLVEGGYITVDGKRGGDFACLYLGTHAGVDANLTVQQNITHLAHMDVEHACERGITASTPSALTLSQAIQAVGLAGYEEERVANLSSGQQKRVALARLWLATWPCVWILDEPFNALDQLMTRTVLAKMQAHAQAGGIVLVTSHQPLGIDCTVLALQPHTQPHTQSLPAEDMPL